MKPRNLFHHDSRLKRIGFVSVVSDLLWVAFFLSVCGFRYNWDDPAEVYEKMEEDSKQQNKDFQWLLDYQKQNRHYDHDHKIKPYKPVNRLPLP